MIFYDSQVLKATKAAEITPSWAFFSKDVPSPRPVGAIFYLWALPLSVLIHYSYVSNTYTWVRVCVLVACKYAESCAPLLPMTLSINIILIWRKEQTLLEGKKKNGEKNALPIGGPPPEWNCFPRSRFDFFSFEEPSHPSPAARHSWQHCPGPYGVCKRFVLFGKSFFFFFALMSAMKSERQRTCWPSFMRENSVSETTP